MLRSTDVRGDTKVTFQQAMSDDMKPRGERGEALYSLNGIGTGRGEFQTRLHNGVVRRMMGLIMTMRLHLQAPMTAHCLWFASVWPKDLHERS